MVVLWTKYSQKTECPPMSHVPELPSSESVVGSLVVYQRFVFIPDYNYASSILFRNPLPIIRVLKASIN
jgi:hypothetical protein